MKLLFIHSDHLEFETTEAIGDMAETEDALQRGEMEECVTAFVSVESGDGESVTGTVENAGDELRDVAGQLGTDRIVLYPYAHLSEDLAAPDVATDILQRLETELTEEFDVLRAPFGWYKSFEISCKGHPLSELSRHVSAHRHRDEESKEESDADRAPNDWRLMRPDGTRHDPVESKPDVSDDMRAFIESEVEDEVASKGEEPSHLRIMREKGFVDYDDLSDVGNLRWYPRGKLIRDQLMRYVSDLVIEYGGMPVETPVMYDLGARSIREHAGKFGERQYRFDSGDRRMMLRFAACFGQFSIMRDMHISINDLPLRIYEMSTYSFRREQRGEVMGLKRQRAFTMPDMHTATRDMEQAREELLRQAKLALQTSEDLGLNYEPALRMTEQFYADNTDWVNDVVTALDTPVLVELLPERHHYWSAKIDFAAIDGLGRPIENPTVQIDVESAERFDIEYTDGETTHHPPILHYSPSGGIERVMAALLEKTATMETPRLPTWLSPTHVRFIPVSDDHVEHCDELVDTMPSIRADVDDRNESVGKKIARAETDWVPYYAVVGDRERSSEEYGVNIRARDEEHTMTIVELRKTVLRETDDLPNRTSYLPKHLSNHPRFVGS